MKRVFSSLLAAVLSVSLATNVPAARAAERPPAKEPAATPYPEELFQAMQYRLVGPFRGGRSTAVAGVVQDQRTFYMGTTGGGVWKTTDGGLTWRNVTDKVREDKPQPPARAMTEGLPATPPS